MKKWVLRGTVAAIAFGIVVALGAFVFTDNQLSKMYGGHTKVAEVVLSVNAPEKYALINVSVLTPSADSFTPGQTVMIENGKIKTVASDIDVAEDIPAIDGEGLFLVPGFTDSHVHLWESENDLLLYIANGVTQIREMNGSKAHLRWKEEIAAGRIGPDMYVVAPQVATFGFFEGLLVGWTQNKTIARSRQGVERVVQSFKKSGYDAVKASSFLDANGYAAIGEAATKSSIPLVGHIPMAVGLDEFIASPQTETAHIEELVKGLDRAFGGYLPNNADEFLDYVRTESDQLAARLRESDKAIASTLALIDSFPHQKTDLASVLNNSELEYVNPGITEGVEITSRGMGWLPNVNLYRWPDGITDKQKEDSVTYWTAYAEAHHIVFEALLEAGVPILAGTDANVPVMAPGFSLHEEIKALHDAGMSRSQALASATTAPAAWANANTGEVSPGFKANLVLLRDNPLEDIGATSSIETVIMNGRIFSRNDLDLMLQAVLDANDSSRTVELVD